MQQQRLSWAHWCPDPCSTRLCPQHSPKRRARGRKAGADVRERRPRARPWVQCFALSSRTSNKDVNLAFCSFSVDKQTGVRRALRPAGQSLQTLLADEHTFPSKLEGTHTQAQNAPGKMTLRRQP